MFRVNPKAKIVYGRFGSAAPSTAEIAMTGGRWRVVVPEPYVGDRWRRERPPGQLQYLRRPPGRVPPTLRSLSAHHDRRPFRQRWLLLLLLFVDSTVVPGGRADRHPLSAVRLFGDQRRPSVRLRGRRVLVRLRGRPLVRDPVRCATAGPVGLLEVDQGPLPVGVGEKQRGRRKLDGRQ